MEFHQKVEHIMDTHCTILTLAICGVQIGVVENQHSTDREDLKRYAGRWKLTCRVIKRDCKLLFLLV